MERNLTNKMHVLFDLFGLGTEMFVRDRYLSPHCVSYSLFFIVVCDVVSALNLTKVTTLLKKVGKIPKIIPSPLKSPDKRIKYLF